MSAPTPTERDARMSADRLRWIESWALGWRTALNLRYPAIKGYYAQLPLDVAIAMIEELAASLRDPSWALSLIADELHESGLEIGELIESRRASGASCSSEENHGG